MSTVEGIEAEIRRKARRDAKVKRELATEVAKVKAAWVSHSPVDSGEYAASIEIQNRPDVDGFPAQRVVAKAWYAHFIEFGTGPDTKEGSPFGMDTPTPAFAPRAKTAAQFGGDESPADNRFGPLEV